MDQETRPPVVVVELHEEVARLLQHPAGVALVADPAGNTLSLIQDRPSPGR